MRKKSKIYLHMFFSYLGILVIPMALAMVLYIYTFRVITGQAETMNENLLVMVKNEIEQRDGSMSGRSPVVWLWTVRSSRRPMSRGLMTPMTRSISTIFMKRHSLSVCPRHLLMTCLFCLIIPRKWSAPEVI